MLQTRGDTTFPCRHSGPFMLNLMEYFTFAHVFPYPPSKILIRMGSACLDPISLSP